MNPKFTIDALSLRLDPMPKDELEKEAAAWQALLEEKSKAIANLEIELLDGSADKQEFTQTLIGLREEKAQLNL